MTFRVLLIGAGGVFGSRLAEQLATSGLCELVLSGRSEANAAALLQRGIGTRFAAFDRAKPDEAQLRALGVDLMIDAAGPF